MRIRTLVILAVAVSVIYPSTLSGLVNTGKSYSPRSLAESAGEFAGNTAGKVAGIVSAPYMVLPALGTQALKDLQKNLEASVHDSYQTAQNAYKKAFQAAKEKERKTASSKIEKNLKPFTPSLKSP